MARTLNCVLALVVFVLTGGSAAAQTLGQAAAAARQTSGADPALRADIERLMDITGSSARAAQMAGLISDALLNGLKQQTQNAVPPRVIEVVREVLNTEFE